MITMLYTLSYFSLIFQYSGVQVQDNNINAYIDDKKVSKFNTSVGLCKFIVLALISKGII